MARKAGPSMQDVLDALDELSEADRRTLVSVQMRYAPGFA